MSDSGGQHIADIQASGAGCAWTASSSQPWLVPSVTNGTGSAGLAFRVLANDTAQSRTAVFTIGDQTISVTQTGRSCEVTTDTSNVSLPAIPGDSPRLE